MEKLDPQLEFLVEGGAGQLADTGDAEASFARFGLERTSTPSETPSGRRRKPVPPTDVAVLAQFTGDPDDLRAAGMTIRTLAGDVASGTVALEAVPALAEVPSVRLVEAARAMQTELDLSVPEARVDLVHTGPPGRRGSGVIVGICDSGCDFTHPSFIRPDGTSRILFLWDQGLTPNANETSPAGFGYGVEYTNAQINAALASGTPFDTVRHHNAGSHGTHVTGIAAGDGSAPGQGRPGGTFVGVAPEADIIVVANASNGTEGLGTSTSTVDAVSYMYQQAGTVTRPCVINMSLGDNLGPHDGTSLLERALDNLLGGPGRAFVKSAGNAGAARCHAEGSVASGTTADVRFNQPAGDNGANQIDVWYPGTDTFRVTVLDPAGDAVGPVNVGTTSTVTLPGGNVVRIAHRANDPINGDRRIFLTFTPGSAGTMRSGNWTIRLEGVASPSGGRFDAWIQRGTVVPTFLAPHESPARTISTPGTATEVITAGNYVTRGAGVGSLAASSSRGPTRDGRAAPTVAAPGMLIMSADGESSQGDPYRLDGGTSMASPHVTGTIALMLQKNPNQTQAQIKQCLESSARSDVQTGAVPNTAWGAGKLDANAAVDCVPSPVVRSVTTPCPVSVPRVTCPVSVPRTTCPQPSVAFPCASVVGPACPPPVSVAGTGCPPPVSLVGSACPPLSLAACPPVSLACPSVAGCPSLACVPGPLSSPEGAPAPGSAPPAQGAPEAAPPVPPEGYFEYDESWFDE